MMAILLAVLKWIGILLLVLLILLLLLLVVPMVIDAEYRPDAPRVQVRILGIPFRVWPKPWWLRRLTEHEEAEDTSPPVEPVPPAAAAAPVSSQPASAQTAAPLFEKQHVQAPMPKTSSEAGSPPTQQAHSAPPLQELPGERKMSRLLRILSAAGSATRVACKGIWVSLWIEWPVQGQDAADTALAAGKWNARVGALCALAANLFRFRLRQLYLAPDFLAAYKQQGHIRLRVAASPVFLLAAGVAFFTENRPK